MVGRLIMHVVNSIAIIYCMNEITLKEFIDGSQLSQEKVGGLFGATQGAVWQMLKLERGIFVVLDGDEKFDHAW